MSISATNKTLEDTAAQAISINLGYNIGPHMLGSAFDVLLFGVAVHQLIIYFAATSNERRTVLAIVIFTATCMTGNTVFLMYRTWASFVKGFGRYTQFLEDGYKPVIFLLMFTIVPVQLFYLERAYKLYNRKKWILIAVCPLLLASWGGGIALLVNISKLTLAADTHELMPYVCAYEMSVMLADLVLSGSIIHALRKSKSGWAHTDGVVNRLIRMTFESQLPCTVFAVVILVATADTTNSMFNRFWSLWYAKIYNISLYAVLNARLRMLEAGASGNATTFRDQTFARGSRVPHEPVRLDAIHVSTQCYTETHGVPDFQLCSSRRQTSPDDDDVSANVEYSSTTTLAPTKGQSMG